MDISKTRVDEAFSKVFGYSPMVDPRTHAGPLVRKSERNGAHDGEIIIGPVEPQPATSTRSSSIPSSPTAACSTTARAYSATLSRTSGWAIARRRVFSVSSPMPW